MTIRTSEEMQRNGYVVFPFPPELSAAMKSHILAFMGLAGSSSKQNGGSLRELTDRAARYDDEQFTETFAKPFRMFPAHVASLAVLWVESLSAVLGGQRSGVNFVSSEERQKNPALKPDSFDIFWRCVRPGKPDVGAAHADYQFWELVKGTPQEVACPFEYDERWKIWVPLLGCDKTNSLEVIPGSHNQDVPIDKMLTRNGFKPKIQSEWLNGNAKYFTCPLDAFQDSCVLFHDKLVHRGPANNSADVRVSGELTILLKL
jgi:hypothetical protein